MADSSTYRVKGARSAGRAMRALGRGVDALLGDGPPFVRLAGARALATELADQEILDGVVEGWRWPMALRAEPPDRLETDRLLRADTSSCSHPDSRVHPGPAVFVRDTSTGFASQTKVCGSCGMWRRDQSGLHYPRPWRPNLDRAVAEGIDDG